MKINRNSKKKHFPNLTGNPTYRVNIDNVQISIMTSQVYVHIYLNRKWQNLTDIYEPNNMTMVNLLELQMNTVYVVIFEGRKFRRKQV